MGSLWDMHAVEVQEPPKKRPSRPTIDREHWREQALSRMWMLARNAGLNRSQVLTMVGVQEQTDLTPTIIERIIRDLSSWNRSTWD